MHKLVSLNHYSRRFGHRAVALLVACALVPVLALPGTAASAATATTVVDSPSAQITYSGAGWKRSVNSGDTGGSVQYSLAAGSASLSFTGTQVTLLSRLSPSSGRSEVRIDGRLVATVDAYSATSTHSSALYTSPTGPRGQHTISVTRTGTKNAASTGTNLIIDAFRVTDSGATSSPAAAPAPPGTAAPTAVPAPAAQPAQSAVPVGTYQNTSGKLVYTGAWSGLNSGSDSGGSSGYLNTAGSASLTFSGTAVRWISRTTPSAGTAEVFIDGALVSTVDRYTKTTLYQQTVFERTGLRTGTHTITIVRTGTKNPASSGSNLVLDSIVVPDTTAPAVPAIVSASVVDGQVLLDWNAVPGADVRAYRVYAANSTGGSTLMGVTDSSVTAFIGIGVPANSRLDYRVSAVDSTGNESARSAVASAQTVSTPASSHRYASCPAATVTVSNAAQLMTAVAKARPGDVVRMSPGTYTGQINLSASGTAKDPIWICGPRNAVVNVGGITKNHGIIVSNSSHLVVTGMTVTNGLKGITVRGSDHVTISDTLVQNIGYEAVHVRENSSDNTIVGNTIRATGLRDPFYGEGVYIGSSEANWCSLTACKPDQSDRNAVVSNSLSYTSAQPIEVKEGTSNGLIFGNTITGKGAMARSESWVKVKGNGWAVVGNTGTDSVLHGFQVNGSVKGWGLRNLFGSNTADVQAAGYGFQIYERSGAGSSYTTVSCTNTVTGATAGFANLACMP
ncbi:right-handed parallel beta-helix repeat-containing protein [Cryobacterium sp.]|uniref:right-handed parallel beta-helix repeat-containing protein n=1 Tax=Cryobacterium sp. TaxID=1926290 RepID=UPI00260EDDCC|nr:right-handed parallel beta-helix repeat-containing protein [Cryobacterium sp.]MCU1444485.1 hypothetical protein [Cryobacterium sp.]